MTAASIARLVCPNWPFIEEVLPVFQDAVLEDLNFQSGTWERLREHVAKFDSSHGSTTFRKEREAADDTRHAREGMAVQPEQSVGERGGEDLGVLPRDIFVSGGVNSGMMILPM